MLLGNQIVPWQQNLFIIIICSVYSILSYFLVSGIVLCCWLLCLFCLYLVLIVLPWLFNLFIRRFLVVCFCFNYNCSVAVIVGMLGLFLICGIGYLLLRSTPVFKIFLTVCKLNMKWNSNSCTPCFVPFKIKHC